MSARNQPVSVYQLKVTLKNSKPPIWRRIQVNSDINLYRLHQILQVAMGWTDSHLHQFIVHGEYYGTPDPDFEAKDEKRLKLNQEISEAGDKFVYEYDFGDSWEHVILDSALQLQVAVSSRPISHVPNCRQNHIRIQICLLPRKPLDPILNSSRS